MIRLCKYYYMDDLLIGQRALFIYCDFAMKYFFIYCLEDRSYLLYFRYGMVGIYKLWTFYFVVFISDNTRSIFKVARSMP